MNRSLSWIEPDQFAKALRKADPNPPKPPAPQATGLSFWRSIASGARPRNDVAPPRRAPTEPAREAVIETFIVPVGTLNERLNAFFDWATRQTKAKQLFVFDEDGLALMELNAEPILVALASSFVN